LKNVIDPMDKSGVESRNRHSPGLAPAGSTWDAAGAFFGAGEQDPETDIGARNCSKPIPVWAENPVKRVASAGQDEPLTQQPNHRTADLTIRSGIWRGGASWLAAALTIGLLASSAPAQTVPLPKPAPKARDNMQMTASEKSPTTTATATAKPPEPVIPDPRRNVPASLFATFDANQKAQAAKVSSYLSSLNTLVGNFVQVGPDGSRSKGDFYIQKPGKLRFEYDAPSTIAMIADGSSVAVRDRKLATQDIYPLSQTPLRYLLSDRIDLMRDTNVVNVTADDLFISVTVEDKSALIGTSRLMLMIGAKDNQLKQWTVTDPQGYDTTVAIYNLDSTKKPDPNLFKIDFTAYPTGGAN
jgi:outer membrane lipoprotein-sorting protein